MLRFFTFGGIGIASDDGSTVPRLRPPRLALLAVVAAADDRGVSRERLASFFWPDADERNARHSVRQALYALRNDLNREVVRAEGAALVLDPAEISADVIEFRRALAAGDRARAVALVRGPFLDGFYLPGAPDFERWVEDQRARLAIATTSALLWLATEAERSNDRDGAVEWWRQLTVQDSLSGRFALGYLKALAARGDRAEALGFARQHEALVRRELEADPDPDIRLLESKLRATPTPEVVRAVGSVDVALAGAEPAADAAPVETRAATARPPSPRPGLRRRAVLVLGTLGLLTLFVTLAFRSVRPPDAPAVIAVGFIREDGVPKSMRGGRVLTDMIATDLSRIEGLSVLSNSRVLSLMRQSSDSAAAYADAARRAGASELLEGRLLIPRTAPLALEIRRVELRTGIVREVYRVTALDQYGLVDSLTNLVALRFRLRSPRSSIADATTSSPLAYRLYEEGLRAYYQSDTKAAQRLMRAALEEDSTFAMAAYYEALAAEGGNDILPDGRHVTDVVRTALRLAARAPERERMTITANLLVTYTDPSALAIAESLTTRYPDDPRAFVTLERARWFAGDWAGAVAALEQAIELDSIGDHKGIARCHLCRDFEALSEVYLWWDSLPAAARVMQRYATAKPDSLGPFFNRAVVAARLGDSVASDLAFQRLTSRGGDFRQVKLALDLTLERYAAVEQEVRPLLASSWIGEWGVGAWNLLIALRNEGRLREATQFQHTGVLAGFPKPGVERSGGDPFNEGILALERGDPRTAATVFGDLRRADLSWWMPGVQARHMTWNGTLRGMALAAAGDTAAVRALADSVEASGRRSAYGRDRKAHHYLRGLVLASAGRHEDAANEFRAAIHSPTLGFTRVNYELARCLLSLDRAPEAIAALQPALRGEVDASNLYITRTDLHELLAQAFDRAGQADSASAHYRAVVKAWRHADPIFATRRARAEGWLARHVMASATR